MSRPSNVVWEYVTKDKYELPIVTADSAEELAKKVGLTANAIRSGWCHSQKRGTKCRYQRVVIDDD